MTDATTILSTFMDSSSGLAVKALFVGTLLVFLLGVFAALRDGTFGLKYIDAFVRSTVWGRVAPVLAVLLLGYIAGSEQVNAAGVIVAGVVSVGLISSALESIQQLTMTKPESAVVNEPPVA